MEPHDCCPIGGRVRFKWTVFQRGRQPYPSVELILSGVVESKIGVLDCGCLVGDCGCREDWDEEYDPIEDEVTDTMYVVLVDPVDAHTYSLLSQYGEHDPNRSNKIRFDMFSGDIVGFAHTSMPVLTQLLQVKGETIDNVPANPPTLS